MEIRPNMAEHELPEGFGIVHAHQLKPARHSLKQKIYMDKQLRSDYGSMLHNRKSTHTGITHKR